MEPWGAGLLHGPSKGDPHPHTHYPLLPLLGPVCAWPELCLLHSHVHGRKQGAVRGRASRGLKVTVSLGGGQGRGVEAWPLPGAETEYLHDKGCDLICLQVFCLTCLSRC